MAKNKNQVTTVKAGVSIVKPCACQHEYQDAVYGKGQRLKIYQNDGKAECTVCGRS